MSRFKKIFTLFFANVFILKMVSKIASKKSMKNTFAKNDEILLGPFLLVSQLTCIIIIIIIIIRP